MYAAKANCGARIHRLHGAASRELSITGMPSSPFSANGERMRRQPSDSLRIRTFKIQALPIGETTESGTELSIALA